MKAQKLLFPDGFLFGGALAANQCEGAAGTDGKGYSNNNYFGKVFKAEKGISPDKYRKQSSKYDLVRAIYETPHI